jgi:hypothetical protein
MHREVHRIAQFDGNFDFAHPTTLPSASGIRKALVWIAPGAVSHFMT